MSGTTGMQPPAKSGESARVVMLETIMHTHTTHGNSLDMGVLLRLMDICTCASAEAYTGVNCVTVAVSDVVLDYEPQLGDVVQLIAEPVLVGRTSLEIDLSVTAESRQPGSSKRTQHRTVCSASFTYVTTRDAQGNKVCCPALDRSQSSEDVKWATDMAEYRKKLLRLEAVPLAPADERMLDESNTVAANGRVSSSTALEMTEVVLPPHQNHMHHTFGGVVMHWMHKAAFICAARHTGVAEMLRTIAIHRVSFTLGSDVSDHLVFKAVVNAVIDGGNSMEVGVEVFKRNIATSQVQKVNDGYFCFSCFGAGNKPGPRIPPLAAPDGEGEITRVRGALWRHHLLTARRSLLTNLGGAFMWNDAFAMEASLLCLQSARRLLHSSALLWEVLPAVRKTASAPAGASDLLVETARKAWGRESFAIRVRRYLGACSTKEVLTVIKDRRPDWDVQCTGVKQVVEPKETDDPLAPAYDIVRFHTRLPAASRALRCLCLCKKSRRVVELSLLRSWREQDDGVVSFASRSVQHPETDPEAEVLPSGWLLTPAADKAGVDLTYVMEIEFETARAAVPGLSDDRLVSLMAGRTVSCVEKLATLVSKTQPKKGGLVTE